MVFVIDGVDECASSGDPKGDFVSVLTEGLVDLPPFVRFILMDRPDEGRIAQLSPMNDLIWLYDLEATSKPYIVSDLGKYFKYRLDRTAQGYWGHDAELDWPGQARRDALVKKSAGLFVWGCNNLRVYAEKNNWLP